MNQFKSFEGILYSQLKKIFPTEDIYLFIVFETSKNDVFDVSIYSKECYKKSKFQISIK